MFKKFWRYSKLRFYILNFLWNFKFWMFAKKIYKFNTYQIKSDEFFMDYSFKIVNKNKTVTKKRFVGYMYKNQIFLDNPGIQGLEYDVWEAWRKKGLIK